MYEILKEKLSEKYDFWGQDIQDSDLLDLTHYDLQSFISSNTEFKLYRYMPAEYFAIRNIETQTIHLSYNGVLNDIYEGLPVLEKEIPYYKLQELNNLAAMTCFTECHNNTLMWSHYANQHAGICVEYNVKQLSTDPLGAVKHLFPVLYGKKRYICRDIDSLIASHQDLNRAIAERYEYDGQELLDDVLPLFLWKGDAWKYEQEWRIVYTRKQIYDIDADELYSGNIPFPCVSGVYLGYRIHPEIKKNILEIVQRIRSQTRRINVYQARIDKAEYNLLFDRIF